jgi:hypothetical protein
VVAPAGRIATREERKINETAGKQLGSKRLSMMISTKKERPLGSHARTKDRPASRPSAQRGPAMTTRKKEAEFQARLLLKEEPLLFFDRSA